MSRGSVKRWGFGTATSRVRGLITDDEWRATGVESAPADGIRSFGVAFSFDGSRVSVAGASEACWRAFTSSWWMRSGADVFGYRLRWLIGWLSGGGRRRSSLFG